MAGVPDQYTGDLFIWFNDVVGNLSATNNELAVLRKYWPQLTAQQKAAIRTSMQNRISDGSTSLTQISAEIGNL